MQAKGEAVSTDASPFDLEAISERYFAAWEVSDPDAIVALNTDDTEFWSHAGQEPARGRDEVRAAFAEVFERFPAFSFEVHRLLHGPDFWVLDWALTFLPDGARDRARFDCLDVVEVAPDGLVARKDTFVDMVQLQAALAPVQVAA